MPETLAIIRWDQAYNRNGNGKLPRAVMNALRTYMNNHTLSGWVTQETLARDTGLSERAVRKQIVANVEAGWLEIVSQGRSSKATVYRLVTPTGTTVPVDGSSEARESTGTTVPVEVSTGTTVPVGTGSTGTTVPGEPEPQFRPTTPRTSPQEKFLGTTPRRGNSGSPFGAPEIPHHGDQDETGHESRSLAVAGSDASGTRASGTGHPPANRQADSEPASASAGASASASEGADRAPEEDRPVGLHPLGRSSMTDPFASEPVWRAEAAARDERATRLLEPASASNRLPDPWSS